MKRESIAAVTLALALVGLLWGLGTDPTQGQDQANDSTAARNSGGYKVYVDPATGDFIEEPADAGALSGQIGRATSGVELVEEPSPVPGGGMMIRTDESSDVFMRAVLGVDHKLSVDCTQDDHGNEKE